MSRSAPQEILVARRAASSWGVMSIDELRECGLSADAVSGRVRRGQLHRLHRGVYAVGHSRPPLEGRFLAALKVCGRGAVLSHFTAATLLGLVRWDGRYPEVTVIGTAARRHRGIRVHRTLRLDPPDVVRRAGMAITSVARTIFDLASQMEHRPLRRVVRQAQSSGLVELSELVDVLERGGRRPGAANLTRIVAAGPAPTRSELEDLVLDLILGAGLARPDIGVPLLLEGRTVIPDFRWPEQRLVIEADGAAWHDHKLAREEDAERQALLEAHGQQVLRVTWTQAVSHPEQTIARLRAAGAPAVAEYWTTRCRRRTSSSCAAPTRRPTPWSRSPTA